MSKTINFLYTNAGTANTHPVVADLIGLTTNYSFTADTSEECTLDNKTAPIGSELITYQCRDIKNINTALNVQYPSPVKSGVQYTIKLEELARVSDSVDPSFCVDEPIVITLSVRHHKADLITNDVITSAFKRLIATIERTNGTFRFDDLMRSAERPITE